MPVASDNNAQDANTKYAMLVLEDGTAMEGISMGAEGEFVGEVVFNTSMTGYQEVITDPSYWGQMVLFTSPHIGNVGINLDDIEGDLSSSGKPVVRAVLARKISVRPSNWRSRRDADGRQVPLGEYLAGYGIPVVSDLDTRRLTLLIREKGVMKAALACGLSRDELPAAAERLLDVALAAPDMSDLSPADEVTIAEVSAWNEDVEPVWHSGMGPDAGALRDLATGRKVVVIDCGAKRNILRLLSTLDCQVTVVPAQASAEEILALAPERIVITNGPGDPVNWTTTIETVAEIINQPPERRVPVFGICLGHQLLALAAGARTYKLPFGHHGANHPVRDYVSGTIEITSQNHNYAVDPESLKGLPLEVTHLNLYDGTIEGIRHTELPYSSVQFHPEASPGPHDSLHLLATFVAG